jgi:hypothetical protein
MRSNRPAGASPGGSLNFVSRPCCVLYTGNNVVRVRMDYPGTNNETSVIMIMVETLDDDIRVSSKPTGLIPNPPQNDETTLEVRARGL